MGPADEGTIAAVNDSAASVRTRIGEQVIPRPGRAGPSPLELPLPSHRVGLRTESGNDALILGAGDRFARRGAAA